ncbi:MAG: HAD-IA family hydrolase [Aureliella sp.]
MTNWQHQIRAVAFDMDGLMVNTEDLYTIVGETILQRRGSRFTPELKNRMMGLPGDAAWQVMIDSENLSDSTATLAAESDEIFERLLPTRLEMLPGLVELLDLLDQHQIPRCVATSSSHRFAKLVLTQIDVLKRMAFVVTADDVANGKPAPDIYLEAAERMRVAAENMLVLEDSHNGSRAGVAAGACTIAVPGEHSADHDFSHVAAIANSLADPLISSQLSNA